MSDLIARLAARATGAPVAAPSAPRSLRDAEGPAHETADDGPVRPDPSAVDRRSSAEDAPVRAARPGPTAEAGTVVAARPRLPRSADAGGPPAGEEAGTSEVPSVMDTVGTPDAGPRPAVDVGSETAARPPLELEPNADAATPLPAAETPPALQTPTARTSEHDTDPDLALHVAVARPRSDPSHPAGGVGPEPEPVVRVHIERLEVHAAPEPTRRSDRRAAAPTPAVSLSEYLRGRREAP